MAKQCTKQYACKNNYKPVNMQHSKTRRIEQGKNRVVQSKRCWGGLGGALLSVAAATPFNRLPTCVPLLLAALGAERWKFTT